MSTTHRTRGPLADIDIEATDSGLVRIAIRNRGVRLTPTEAEDLVFEIAAALAELEKEDARA